MASICNITKFLITVYNNTLFLLQPAKLAEAFKYFVQGMGYSKYWDYGMAIKFVGLLSIQRAF